MHRSSPLLITSPRSILLSPPRRNFPLCRREQDIVEYLEGSCSRPSTLFVHEFSTAGFAARYFAITSRGRIPWKLRSRAEAFVRIFRPPFVPPLFSFPCIPFFFLFFFSKLLERYQSVRNRSISNKTFNARSKRKKKEERVATRRKKERGVQV